MTIHCSLPAAHHLTMIKKPLRIIIDTNALMAISQFRIDLFTAITQVCSFNFRLFIHPGTITELNKIKDTGKGAQRSSARLALQILEHALSSAKISLLPQNCHCSTPVCSVDEELILRSQLGNIILTQDRALKKRLVRPYLTIRQKKKVIIIE